MSTLRFVQDEVRAWSADNFGEQPSWKPLLGIGEELGELQHHYLKRAQGIRTTEDHDAGIRDAVADILIYLCDFCAREDIDLDAQLAQTWHEVKQRNWRASPQDGTSGISTSVASTASECWLAGWRSPSSGKTRYWTSTGLLTTNTSDAARYHSREEADAAHHNCDDFIILATVWPGGEVEPEE